MIWISWWIITPFLFIEVFAMGLSTLAHFLGKSGENIYPPLSFSIQYLAYLILSHIVWVTEPSISDLIEQDENK